jgi:hypothetical protein
LSTGEKVGLGIGIPLGIIALGGLAVVVWMQQRRIKRAEQGMATRTDENNDKIPHAAQQPCGPTEIDSHQSITFELPAGAATPKFK